LVVEVQAAVRCLAVRAVIFLVAAIISSGE
jgi:hypothetical protein